MKCLLPMPLSLSPSLGPYGMRVIALLLALLVTLGVAVLSTGWVERWDAGLGSQAWTLAPERQAEKRLVVVAIDEKSLAEVGAWPWSRDILAQLAQRLDADGAALQLYDIALPEMRPGSQGLAETLAGVPAVLAQVPYLDGTAALRTGQMGGAVPGMRCQHPLPSTAHYLGNHATFDGLPKGHITPRHDSDGAVRQQPPLICVEGRVYPSLALRGLLHLASPASKLAPDALRMQAGEGWLAPQWQLEIATMPDIALPMDNNGDMRIPFHQSSQVFTVLPAVDVLEQRHDPAWLDGAIVLVGATAFGLGDVIATPVGAQTPGVELQARLLSGLLDQRIPYAPQGQLWYFAVVMLLSAGLLYMLASRPGRGSFIGLPLAALGLPLLLLGIHSWVLLKVDLWLGWLLPSLYAVLAGLLLLVVEYARTRLERQRLFSNLSSYLPYQMARQIAFQEPGGTVEARRESLIVLCADLRNYSAVQDVLQPEEAAGLLHGFLVEATRLIEMQGGSIYTFQGDAVIATWPDKAGSALAALSAGRELLDRGGRILPQQLPGGLEPLGLGVGIEVGSALVGSIGPARRRHHILLGQPLSQALQIQAMTAELGQPLLLGDRVADALQAQTRLQDLGSYLLEGTRKPTRLYALPPHDVPEPVLPKAAPHLTLVT